MKDHFDKIEWLLLNLDFNHLNESDQNLVIEALGSKEAYIFTRQHLLLAKGSQSELDKNVLMKEQLLEKFKEKHSIRDSTKNTNVLKIKIPAYYTAAAILLFFISLIFMFNQKTTVVKEVSYITTAPQIDTLFVQSPADTVFVNQVVYQKVMISKTDTIFQQVKNEPIAETNENWTIDDPINTSFADNKALNSLLVSIQ